MRCGPRLAEESHEPAESDFEGQNMPAPKISESIFFIDVTSQTSLQAQVRGALISGILSGRLMPGVHLPSTRKLAEYLNISRLTVTLAYQELVAQGYLVAKRRSAFAVNISAPTPSEPLEPAGNSEGQIDWQARLGQDFVIAKSIIKPTDWRRYPYPFIYGQMDMSLFDLAAWRDCSRRALARDDFELMAGDFAAADDIQLVTYIASRTLPRRGIKALPEEILVTMGAQNALWIVSQLLLDRGSHAVYENPGHPDIHALLRISGARLTIVDVDHEGLPPHLLPEHVDAVFVTPSHQSPTAARMSVHRRTQLLELAQQRDFVIVEDDYEFDMSFIAPPAPALKSLDRYGRVLYVGSFSKSLFPGLRLGYLVAPAPFIRQARALRALQLRHPPGHLQRTAAYFLGLGHYDAVNQKMRQAFRKRYEVMALALERAGLSVVGPGKSGGTSFWIEGPPGLDAEALALDLRPHGVLIEPGAPFFADSDAPCRFFRMACSSIAVENIVEGVERTAALVHRSAGSNKYVF